MPGVYVCTSGLLKQTNLQAPHERRFIERGLQQVMSSNCLHVSWRRVPCILGPITHSPCNTSHCPKQEGLTREAPFTASFSDQLPGSCLYCAFQLLWRDRHATTCFCRLMSADWASSIQRGLT